MGRRPLPFDRPRYIEVRVEKIRGIDDLTREEKQSLYRRGRKDYIKRQKKKWYKGAKMRERKKRREYYYLHRDEINAKKRKNPVNRLSEKYLAKLNEEHAKRLAEMEGEKKAWRRNIERMVKQSRKRAGVRLGWHKYALSRGKRRAINFNFHLWQER